MNYIVQRSLFIITSPDSPFPSQLAVGTSPSLHNWGIMGMINLAVLCITVCRTSNESLIRLGCCLFEYVRAHFYKGIKRVCGRTGTHLFNPGVKTKYTYFLSASFPPKQNKKT